MSCAAAIYFSLPFFLYRSMLSYTGCLHLALHLKRGKLPVQNSIISLQGQFIAHALPMTPCLSEAILSTRTFVPLPQKQGYFSWQWSG
ncbi:MAG: hypothetical protein D3908_14435 [Candidatus Electrothrix sp. AUS4]|nr:hypothetical protein [Candidatus Electrothrix sp. AUS4]